MNRVLVTGATGCLGRHVVPQLVARGWDVHAVSSREIVRAAPDVVWHRANLFDGSQAAEVIARSKPTHLLHLAWFLTPRRWASAPENFAWVQASLVLLQAFRAHDGQRIVTAGSCLEYDWRYGYCSEERTPCVPHTAYGTCKHALQLLTSAFAAATGFASAWGRIFNMYGPYEHEERLVASVIRALLRHEPARCSHGNQIRDYLFVQDAADAFIALLESSVTGPINIAYGTPVALRDIVTRIGALLERPDLIHLGAIPAAPTDLPLVAADVAYARKVLSWTPRIDFDEGLMRSIEWWREQLFVTEGQRS